MKQYVQKYTEFLNEAKKQHFLLDTKEKIEYYLRNKGIKKYTIHPDLVVDIHGKLILEDDLFGFSRFQYGTIEGGCIASRCDMETLRGAPKVVYDAFMVHDNNLKTLEYCPRVVFGVFACSKNPLTTLVLAPKEPYSFEDMPCSEIYKRLGWTDEAHIESLTTLDPNPKETLVYLRKVNRKLYNTLIKKSRELRFIMGIEQGEVVDTYNKVKDIEKGYF